MNSKKLKIAIIGYGKMGKAIEEIALLKGHEIILKISSANQQDLTTETLKAIDVAIEFTSPETAASNIYTCIDAGVPVVCGTTGWLEQSGNVQQYCRDKGGALLYASNFSIGVNIFFEVNKRLAALMADQPDYDVKIEEVHHTQKKDSPSGTAISLAEQVINEISRKTSWVNHPAEHKEELVIESIRMDPAAGRHMVQYNAEEDTIEIIHTAHNRKGFAAGAVMAAEFLTNKRGLFSMKDVVGF